MKELYSRNRLYITQKEQQLIKNYSILLAGSGIGSNIAECALRLGFEKITIVDGDRIELSNLNRQNYTHHDLREHKTECLLKRLKAINPKAKINFHSKYITDENVTEIIAAHNITINALDFTTDIPLKFDRICQQKNIPILHPYNLGWAGLVAVITSESPALDSIISSEKKFSEIDMVKYILNSLKTQKKTYNWLHKTLELYEREKKALPPPQLSIASWIVAGMCTHIMFNLATKKEFKKFPEFYISSILD